MPRNDKSTRKRRHDTRLSFKEICNRAGVSPRQRLIMIRLMKKEVDITITRE